MHKSNNVKLSHIYGNCVILSWLVKISFNLTKLSKDFALCRIVHVKIINDCSINYKLYFKICIVLAKPPS